MAQDRARRRFTITGVVQGVGFRPFVHGLATRLGLGGWVLNDGRGVVVEAEGAPDALDAFAAALRAEAPPLARIATLAVAELAAVGERTFRVDASRAADDGAAGIPPDVATCDDCLRELGDPADRRHRYPFINCTNCGPRFTIVVATPYDRARTTMAPFAMCADCAREYHDPSDRRFHAEPVACPACGPRVWWEEGGARREGEDAIARCIAVLRAGGVAGIKGVGGFHLACDARDAAAVARLRERKRRPARPLAIMAASLAQAREVAVVDDAAARLLADRARPIVLLPAREGGGLAPGVAPGVGTVGVMLPYSPLHHLLAGAMPMVLTSGNLTDEPIAIDEAEARARLGAMVDGFLMHDRPIHVSCDDSVVRLVRLGDGHHELPMRRSRGHAPLGIALAADGPAVLAMGGDLKAACGIAVGTEAILSQHVGDQESPPSQAALERAAAHLLEAWRASPAAIAADLHPAYWSATCAARLAREQGLPLVRVQHHHAHVAAVLAEHGRDGAGAGRVIGAAMDGTGYGDDGAIWGGEWLVANAAGYTRVAHLAYVPLPGGDAAIRRPRRVALAHLRAAGIAWADDLSPLAATPAPERPLLARQLETGLSCVPTSSMGRLVDALASLAGVGHEVAYEAQAAMELEALAAAWLGGPLDDALLRDAPAPAERPGAGDARALDPAPLLAWQVAGARAGLGTGELAARAHAGVVRILVAGCELARTRGAPPVVAMGGGVFLNALVLEGATRLLRAAGFDVLLPTRVPPGDGGLALGQLAVARARLLA